MVRTIKLPRPPKRKRPQRECEGTEMPCVICHKPMLCCEYMVHVVDGGASLCHPSDKWDDDSSDLYWYPIGRCCLRQHPELKPFAVKN